MRTGSSTTTWPGGSIPMVMTRSFSSSSVLPSSCRTSDSSADVGPHGRQTTWRTRDGRTAMGSQGFTTHIPQHWNRWWILYWLLASPALIVSAFFLDFAVWVVLAVI